MLGPWADNSRDTPHTDRIARVDTLLLSSFAFLFLPWLCEPLSRRGVRRPEVSGFLEVLWWINRAYCTCMHRLITLNDAPLPEHGPAILVANHTSGVDNLVLQSGCRRVLGFMVAQEFYDSWLVGPFCRLLRCIPVRRDGRDLSATREALRALHDGLVLPIFPEGRITPESGRVFGPGRPGAAFLTIRAKVPVIPAYIRGTPPTNNVWRGLITPSRARVIYGPPIDFSDLLTPEDDRRAERERLDAITQRLMDAIKALRELSLAREATL
jgi:1-acyl-sn-glycerol-3-phosphate acyltransferase